MRRLPGPAFCRLSEGVHPPEALYELFRDWQRTQTQSSVTALQGLRQQMDVWFCRAQEPMPRGIFCALNILELLTARSRERARTPRVRPLKWHMIHSPVHFRTPFSDFRHLLRIAYSVNRKINDLVEMAFGIKRAISRMRKSYGGCK